MKGNSSQAPKLATRRKDVMGGLPCFRGTRIPISSVQSFWEGGYTAEQIVKQYPSLTVEQVAAARSWGRHK